MLSCILGFLRKQKGIIAINFSVLLVPILTTMAFIVDYSKLLQVQNKIQHAADTAVLATAGNINATNPADIAVNAFNANLNSTTNTSALQTLTPTVTINGNVVTLDVSTSLNTLFAQVLGYGTFDFTTTSKSIINNENMEISLVFDATASMGQGDNWSAATDALESTLNVLKTASGNSNFYASFIPFSDRVNVGWDRAAWFTAIPNDTTYQGCIEPREEPHETFDFAVDDTAPAGSDRFNPTAEGYFTGNSHEFGFFSCPIEMVELTNDINALITHAKTMSPGGSGRFDTALAWAWRSLSPKWRGYWDNVSLPANYEDSRKVVVFVTDGRTSVYSKEVLPEGGPNNFNGRQFGTTDGFEHMAHVCERMKAEGIEIFTVYADLDGNDYVIPYLQQCASDENHYFTINNSSQFVTTLSSMLPSLLNIRLLQ